MRDKPSTSYASTERYKKLRKGYPKRNPKTGEVTVTDKPMGRPKRRTPSERSQASERDRKTIQERQRVERAFGVKRGGS